MSVSLTGGAIESIMQGNQVDKPVLQVLGQKKIASQGGQGADRYRLLLSDGVHSHSSAMLATQLNDKVLSGELDMFAVIQLQKYMCNTIQPDRRVMILLDIEVLGTGPDVGQKLGNPQPFKQGAGASGPGPSAPAPAPATNNRPPSSVGGGAAAASSHSPPSANGPPKPSSFYGNQSAASGQTYGASPKTFGKSLNNNLPGTPGGTPGKTHPISSLTPYQNRWTIKARVTSKSAIRTWSNSRGEGKLFSINLLDKSGEIRATLFKEEVDKYYDMIELNKVYYISKATLKTANKQYSNLDNDYEMTFNKETTLIPCEEETDMPSLSFNFVPINQLDSKQPGSGTIDVIGAVKSAAELSKVTSKTTQREIIKRDITLVDEGKVQVRLTLWGTDAEKFDTNSNPILAVKGARLSDWGGRSLSALSSSQVLLDPDIPEAHHLRGWFDSVGHSMAFDEFKSDGSGGSGGSGSTNWKTFMQVKSDNLGVEKADYFTSKATIIYLKKENCMYMACPTESCNKKVIDQANGMYRCEKCQKEFPNYKWRMILSANLADFSDSQWATCFQETAETILGKSADDIGQLREQNEGEFDQMFSDANFKSYVFTLRTKMETYNDEQRLKTTCVKAVPVDYREYSKKLISEIETMLAS